MESTSPSLLMRLGAGGDPEAWRRFHALYEPLLRRYARLRGLSADEAEEVAQQCMAKLVETLPRFDYAGRKGSFRTYLRTMADNVIKDERRRRARHPAEPLPERSLPGGTASPAELWERAWRHRHLRWCLQALRKEIPGQQYRAFWRYVIDGVPAGQVATEVGLSVSHVYVIKSRLLNRIRSMVFELVGESI